MTEYKMRLEDWLDDLCVRFVINLPKEDLSSVERICFQVEEAQWFYEDFIRPLDPALPSMSLRSFCLRIFQHCPLLSIFSQEHHMAAFEEFLMYKNRIPVRGAIMLNHSMDSAVLVKGWKKQAAWSFPRGKISKDEDDLDCAIREVYEETGFDIRAAGLVPNADEAKFIDIPMREQHIRLYVFRDVPVDTHFEPRTRKEISKIDWFKLADLPAFRKKNAQIVDHAEVAKNANKFYMVAPFLVPLKKWVQQQKHNDLKRTASNGNVQNQLNEETEEEGFKSSIDAVDARNARNMSQRLDTMEGATAALQQLLKIQPPTQGLQDTNSPPPPAVLRNTGNDLLTFLRGPPAQKTPSPPNGALHQQNNGFNSRQPPFNMQQQQQPQHFPGPHIVLDQPRQPMPEPRDMRNGQFMMPQPFPQTPQESNFGQQSMSGNSYPRPPPGIQQPYRQPPGPQRDVRSIQMQMPPSVPRTPIDHSFNPMQAPRNPHHHTNNLPPADAHRNALLNAFSTPSAPQNRPVATPEYVQLARNPLQQNNMPPSTSIPQAPLASQLKPVDPHRSSLLDMFNSPATKPAALAQPEQNTQAPKVAPREAPQQPFRQPRMPQMPMASAPPTSVSIPVIDPDAPRPRQARPPGADISMGRRTPRFAKKERSRPQSTEKAVPFKPTAILSRPQQAASREVTPQPENPLPRKVDSRAESPERPDVHEMRRKHPNSQRQKTPPAPMPFAPMILKRPETKVAEQEAAAAPPPAPALSSLPSPPLMSPPITASVAAALAAKKPSFSETVEQKKDLLSMFTKSKPQVAAPEQQEADIRSLFKAPEQPKPNAPQQKADLFAMIKEQEKKQTIQDQKADLLSLLKSPINRPTSSQGGKDVPAMSLRANRRPSADGMKFDSFSQFKAPGRRPSTVSDQKDKLLDMFKAPEMMKSTSQSSQQSAFLKFQAPERRPSVQSDKKMDLLSMFQTQSKPAVPEQQQKADLLSGFMRGRDAAPKRDVFDLSRFRSPDARAPAPTQAPEQQKNNLLSMLGQPRPAPPQQQKSADLLSMFNGQQQPQPQQQQQPQQQHSRGAPVDPQKAHLLPLMGGRQPTQEPQQNRPDMQNMFNRAPGPQSPGAGQATNFQLLNMLKSQQGNERPAEQYQSAFGNHRPPPGFRGENQAGAGPLPPFSQMRRQSQEGLMPWQQSQFQSQGQQQGHGQMGRRTPQQGGQDKGYLLNYLNGLGKGGGI